MRVLYRPGSSIFWWAIITLLALGLAAHQPGGVLNTFHEFLGNERGKFLSSGQLPFSIVPEAKELTVRLFDSLVIERVGFDPQETLLTVGRFRVPNIIFLALVIVVLGYISYRFYDHAIETTSVVDDIVTLFFFLMGVEIMTRALGVWGYPFFEQGWVKGLAVIIFVSAAILTGEGSVLEEVPVFMRALTQITAFALLLQPEATANILYEIGFYLESLGRQIIERDFTNPIAGFWIVLGLLAVYLWLRGWSSRGERGHRRYREREEEEYFI